jgi:hypothetical protein
VAPLEVDADHAELQAIAKRLHVGLRLNWRARRMGGPFIELFARGVMLRAFWDCATAAAWLQPRQEACHER